MWYFVQLAPICYWVPPTFSFILILCSKMTDLQWSFSTFARVAFDWLFRNDSLQEPYKWQIERSNLENSSNLSLTLTQVKNCSWHGPTSKAWHTDRRIGRRRRRSLDLCILYPLDGLCMVLGLEGILWCLNAPLLSLFVVVMLSKSSAKVFDLSLLREREQRNLAPLSHTASSFEEQLNIEVVFHKS